MTLGRPDLWAFRKVDCRANPPVIRCLGVEIHRAEPLVRAVKPQGIDIECPTLIDPCQRPPLTREHDGARNTLTRIVEVSRQKSLFRGGPQTDFLVFPTEGVRKEHSGIPIHSDANSRRVLGVDLFERSCRAFGAVDVYLGGPVDWLHNPIPVGGEAGPEGSIFVDDEGGRAFPQSFEQEKRAPLDCPTARGSPWRMPQPQSGMTPAPPAPGTGGWPRQRGAAGRRCDARGGWS